MELTIKSETYHDPNAGDIATLQLCGPIDQKSVQVFESTILELYRKGICKLVLDLSETKYLNSTGLGLLINIAHKVNVVGGGIKLINVAEKFKVLFDMLGLESCLPILTNYEEALNSFGGSGAATDIPTGQDAAELPANTNPEPQAEPVVSQEATEDASQGMVGDFLMGADMGALEQPKAEEEKQPDYAQEPIAQLEIPEANLSSDMGFYEKNFENARRTPNPSLSSPPPTQDKPLLRKTLALKPKEINEDVDKAAEKLAEKALEERVIKKIDNTESQIVAALKPVPLIKENPKTPHKPKPTVHILKRRAMVRYFCQVNLSKTYPMAVVISPKAVNAGASKDDAPEPMLEATLNNPLVVVVPRFPGCQVVPDRLAIDISTPKGVAEFWVTPQTTGSPQGQIPGWLDVCYEGKVQEILETPFQVAKHTWTWLSACLTVICSILGIIMERFQGELFFRLEDAFPLFQTLLNKCGGWRPFALSCSAIFFLLTLIFFFWFHDRESAPVEKATSLRMR